MIIKIRGYYVSSTNNTIEIERIRTWPGPLPEGWQTRRVLKTNSNVKLNSGDLLSAFYDTNTNIITELYHKVI